MIILLIMRLYWGVFCSKVISIRPSLCTKNTISLCNDSKNGNHQPNNQHNQKKIANNKEFITQHKQRPQDFTRKHELTPTNVIYFAIGKTGNPMDFETHAFCETLKATSENMFFRLQFDRQPPETHVLRFKPIKTKET
jgi:hypothetical protein